MAIEYLDRNGLAYVFTKIKALISKAMGMQGVTTEGDGAAYTATVDGISALSAGATFVLVPHTTSTVVNPTLNVNDLGAKYIRRRVSNSTVTTVAASSANWLYVNKPIRVTFDGTYWIADMDRPNAADIYGTVPITSGGTGASTAAAALTSLGAQAQHTPITVTLSASGWSSNQQTVTATGVTADNTVIPGPAPASHAAYAECGVYCSAQAANALTFTCDSVPSADLTVNVAVFG